MEFFMTDIFLFLAVSLFVGWQVHFFFFKPQAEKDQAWAKTLLEHGSRRAVVLAFVLVLCYVMALVATISEPVLFLSLLGWLAGGLVRTRKSDIPWRCDNVILHIALALLWPLFSSRRK